MLTCSNLQLRIVSAVIASSSLAILYQATPIDTLSFLIVALTVWAWYKEWSLFFKPTSWQFWIYGILYLGLPCFALIQLNRCQDRFLLPLALLLTFTHDGGSYFIGKTWGEKKLCPHISPNKTWLGLIGGYLCTYAVMIIYQLTTHASVGLKIILLSCIVSTLATVGDLFESWLKRQVHIKDSGSFLPGHGGVLDRIDSLIPVSIFFYGAHDWILTLLRTSSQISVSL